MAIQGQMWLAFIVGGASLGSIFHLKTSFSNVAVQIKIFNAVKYFRIYREILFTCTRVENYCSKRSKYSEKASTLTCWVVKINSQKVRFDFIAEKHI